MKRDLVAAFGGVCIECGYGRSIAALEFHHRDASTKSFTIAKFFGSFTALVVEAQKCDLLCANCHRLRHEFISAYADPNAAAARQALKRQAVDRLGGRCEVCERVYELRIFEFHHRAGENKDFGISQDGIIRTWEEIASELTKCALLCANCHREAHAALRETDAMLIGLAEDRAPYRIAA